MMSEKNESQLSKNAFLIINSQVIPLKQEITKIGRKLDNEIVIQDVLVSREHAEIRFENGEFILCDLKSTGGTYINNKKIEKGTLYSGDIILLASVPIMFITERTTLSKESEKETGTLEI